jgi:hypothetical protein
MDGSRWSWSISLPYAVPEDWRKAARNLILFMLVLIPIAWHDGMF